jgi:predicted transglutaminase-like cysteine proteinase
VPDSQDRWLTPTEFVRRGGDCEDYAIAKYLLLKSLGVSSSSMRIVALGARPGIAAHSVLVVDSPKGPVVLDNQRRTVYPLARAQISRTVYAFNDSSWWIPVNAFSTLATSR